MTERVPVDQPARDTALDPGRSFIVQAPAGSGKTELLTQRFLRLLAVAERPEEIIAITFTRKAAGEMRQRILDALALGGAPDAPEEAHRHNTWRLARAALANDRDRGWQLLENPRRLRVETIDALNAWLARQLPLASRLGAPPVIADDTAPVYREAARNTLLAATGRDGDAAHARALLAHMGGRFSQAEDLLVGLLRARDHWLHKIMGRRGADAMELRRTLELALEHFVEDELRRAREDLPSEVLEELAGLAAGAAARSPHIAFLEPWTGSSGFPEPVAAELPRWRALAKLLLTQKGWRKTVNKTIGFPPGAKTDKARLVALLEVLEAGTDPDGMRRVLKLPVPAYDETRWEILEHLIALLPIAAARLDLAFAARGESDYVGIARAALDALGGETPTDLALALDCRISHLLVDEFQDTSQAQVELLERLTAGWSPGDGRSLFCVGDPMQSIYRFREADVSRFLKARKHGIGDLPLEPLQLQVNFRSQARLVDWVSSRFPSIFPAREDLSLGAVPFEPSVPWHPALPGVPVNCMAAAPGDRRDEAGLVAHLVADLRRREPDASIAILVRSRNHLSDITPALKNAGVPVQAIEIERLARVPAIRDLEALARALCHRADRTAWLAVLRAPWCGIELADLLAVAGSRDEDIWARANDPDVAALLSADARGRVARVVAALAPALEERGRRPLRRVVEGAWLALGGPATLERDSELADAQSFLEFLDRRARHGDLDDPPALNDLLAELYAAPESAAAEAVQLLTIHKAKGLEFDHVVLPALDRPSGRNEKRLLRWLEQVREEGTDLILAPVERFGEDKDDLHDALRALDARRELLELDRVLYVAATRARSRLHLVAGIGPDHADTGAAPKPRSGTLLSRLWSQLGEAFCAARDARDTKMTEVRLSPPAMLRRLAADWQPPPLPEAAHWRGLELEPPSRGELLEYDWAGRQARAVGIAVHRLLQVISREGPEAWDIDRLRGAQPRLSAMLREAGLGEPELAGALDQSLEALEKTLADPRGRWLLDAGLQQAASERRISGHLDGRIFSGIVDRCFIDAAGVLWIVDYKAGRHTGGALEAFLDREQERYRPQLERYARLLAADHPGAVRLGLYFPQHSGWREWPAPQ